MFLSMKDYIGRELGIHKLILLYIIDGKKIHMILRLGRNFMNLRNIKN